MHFVVDTTWIEFAVCKADCCQGLGSRHHPGRNLPPRQTAWAGVAFLRVFAFKRYREQVVPLDRFGCQDWVQQAASSCCSLAVSRTAGLVRRPKPAPPSSASSVQLLAIIFPSHRQHCPPRQRKTSFFKI